MEFCQSEKLGTLLVVEADDFTWDAHARRY